MLIVFPDQLMFVERRHRQALGRRDPPKGGAAVRMMSRVARMSSAGN
jgi:hypothetical protein